MTPCELCDRLTKRPGLCSRCASSLIGLRIVPGQALDETVIARGGYPPPLSEVVNGDDD